jgi:cell division protein FtsL
MGRGAAAAAPRRSHAQPRAGRPTTAPRRGAPRPPAPPRRRSGHARGARANALPAPLPLRMWDAPFARAARVRTGRMLDALLSGRGWIALVFLLLAGIVFFNVDLLQMNRDIARNSEKISALKRENARLLLDQARLANSERIQEEAVKLGLVLPAPGEVRYLKARPSEDARRAAKRITVPTEPYTPPGEEDAVSGSSESAAGIDPVTGFPVDPTTGQPVYDPVTGAPLDPATGEPLDLSGAGTGAAAPSGDVAAGTTTDTTATGTTGATTDPAAQPVG